MAQEKFKPTDDVVEILHRRYVKDDPEILAELEKIQADNDVARKIYDLLKKIQKRGKEIRTSKICND